MPEEDSNPKKTPLSPDKLIQGILSKLGETFDGLFGRKAEASSTLATSEIAARTKKMLDTQVRDLGEKGKFVPHEIQLKVEWGKFSTDSMESLKTLEHELLTAVIDHINDHRYLTFAPLKITAKPDYFVTGIHIVTSFGEPEKENDEVDLSVTMPQIKVDLSQFRKEETEAEPAPEVPEDITVIAAFSINDVQKEKTLRFAPGQRLDVGRTRVNGLVLEDGGVSQPHAVLYINSAGELLVSDLRSTNGTFINKERLAYGQAFVIKEGDMVTFGTVNVFFNFVVPEPEPAAEEEAGEMTSDAPTEEHEGPIRIGLDNESEHDPELDPESSSEAGPELKL
jgi:pSer/pThr/pTyr-binding forkhead associated (FHA) protein